MTLQQLAIDHPYYCADNNYYSKDCFFDYDDWSVFFEEMGNADKDLNLLFRWDVEPKEEATGYYMQLFFMQQRKGRFVCCQINNIQEINLPQIMEYLTRHYEYLQRIWEPIPSKQTNS